jgi:hypothetical protein
MIGMIKNDFEEIMMSQTVKQNLASAASHTCTFRVLLSRIVAVEECVAKDDE